jgi:hypothetical protein
LTFSSQYGPVNVAALPVVFRNGQPVAPQTMGPASAQPGAPPANPAAIYEAIEQLASLRSKGVLTEQEYAAKKAELLARI